MSFLGQGFQKLEDEQEYKTDRHTQTNATETINAATSTGRLVIERLCFRAEKVHTDQSNTSTAAISTVSYASRRQSRNEVR